MVPNNGPPFRHLCLFPSERNRYNIRLRSSVDGFLAATVLVCPKGGGGGYQFLAWRHEYVFFVVGTW